MATEEDLITTDPDTQLTALEFIQSEWDSGVLHKSSNEARDIVGIEGIPDITREEALMLLINSENIRLQHTHPSKRDYSRVFTIDDAGGEPLLVFTKHSFREWRKVLSESVSMELADKLLGFLGKH